MFQENGKYLNKANRDALEKRYINEKRRQSGISFPSAIKQEHVFIIRFDIADDIFNDESDDHKKLVRNGLKKLCELFDLIDKGKRKIEKISDNGEIKLLPLSHFNFSSTIGFGIGFFEKLNISQTNRPSALKEMPDNIELGDADSYILRQTDFIIQLCSQVDYVNRWVFQNSNPVIHKQERMRRLPYPGQSQTNKPVKLEDIPEDIITATSDWAKIVDIHAGFQRIDGKNLLGFNDGISNPDRLLNTVVWTTLKEEKEKFKDSTYMVFQKIDHDLEKWQNMQIEKQEQWIGRSKSTGLLLGTLTKEEDQRLGFDMHSDDPIVRERALKKWKKLYKEQQDPEKRFFDNNINQFKNIQLQCPVWSHVRKANPRQAYGAPKSLIFRRGYLYMEGSGLNGKFNSGLLFICFQKNIENSFEHIKKNFLNNTEFPLPQLRANFKPEEIRKLHLSNNFVDNETMNLNQTNTNFNHVYGIIKDKSSDKIQTTGKDGLSGPSELGVNSKGQIPITTTLGGGYYFIPSIPNRRIAEISEQFFY
jgi:Dyp-type peroxidase family